MLYQADYKWDDMPVVCTSAPCRLDFGGTLDIPTFHYPLQPYRPATFNLALNMRTTVVLTPHDSNRVKISSRGFEPAEFNSDALPFRHPMGLMFAVAATFGARGVHIDIQSSSPPKSALGGSSVAAVALVGAFYKATGLWEGEDHAPSRAFLGRTVRLAHMIESAMAGVPCGIQDQLAAAFGGVNLWDWTADPVGSPFSQTSLSPPGGDSDLGDHMVAVFSGKTHVSADVNGKWVDDFLSGNQKPWQKIIEYTRAFADAVSAGSWDEAASLMNQETALRCQLTPDVLDDTGYHLWEQAKKHGCGARFTGAGGGGCLWAIGAKENIKAMQKAWAETLSGIPDALFLDNTIDGSGLVCHGPNE